MTGNMSQWMPDSTLPVHTYKPVRAPKCRKRIRKHHGRQRKRCRRRMKSLREKACNCRFLCLRDLKHGLRKIQKNDPSLTYAQFAHILNLINGPLIDGATCQSLNMLRGIASVVGKQYDMELTVREPNSRLDLSMARYLNRFLNESNYFVNILEAIEKES